jgi:hypothetical protein
MNSSSPNNLDTNTTHPDAGKEVEPASDALGRFVCHWDLMLAALVALGLPASAWLGAETGPWRFVLGLWMVLLIPGYLLVTFLFPRSRDLDGIERIALGFALSVAIIILLALLLAEVHIALTDRSELTAITAVVIALVVGVAWRRTLLPEEARYQPRVPRGVAPTLTCGVVILVGLATWWVVGTNLAAVQSRFYISDSHDMLAGRLKPVAIGSIRSVRLHVKNPTGRRATYRVREHVDGFRPTWELAKVEAFGTWVRREELPASGPPRRVRLRFTFFRHSAVAADLWISYRIVRD